MAALPDGRVVVAGGFDGQRGLASVEVVEVVASPQPGGNLLEASRTRTLPVTLTRRRAAAGGALVALPGSPLAGVAGPGARENLSGPHAQLYLFYGMEAVGEGMEPPTAEVVDLGLGTVTPLPAPPGAGRVGPSATLLQDGTILIAGGAIPSTRGGADAYVFETRGGTYTPVPATMAVPRGDHAAALLDDGRVLLAGGVTARHTGGATDTLEIYDPATKRFTLLGSRLPSPRTGLAGTALGGNRAALLGGFAEAGVLSDVLVVDAKSGAVTLEGKMSVPRYYFAAVTLPDGRVLAGGGGMGNLAMRDSLELWPAAPAR